MPVLNSVADYIRQARVLLQDLVVPYRYSDIDLVDGLNMAVADIARLRPDLCFKLFRTASFPFYSASAPTTVVAVDYRYRSAALAYIVGLAQLRDAEETTDAHAAALLQKFTAELMTLQA